MTGRFVAILNREAERKGLHAFDATQYPGKPEFLFSLKCILSVHVCLSEHQDRCRHDCLSIEFLQQLINDGIPFALVALQATDGYFLPYGQGHYFLNVKSQPFYSLGKFRIPLSLSRALLPSILLSFTFRLIGFQTVLKRGPAIFGELARKAIPDGLMADNVARTITWQAFMDWSAAVAMPSIAPPLPPGVTVEEVWDESGNIIRRSCHLDLEKVPCFLPFRGTLRLAEMLTAKERKDGKFVLTDFCALRVVR